MNHHAFSKMHGLGNDFVVINALDTPFDWSKARISALADRHCGIGFDQLLVIEPPPYLDCDFAYRIFNADGNEVEHCGNGARCFGKYIRDNHLLPGRDAYRVAVKKGHIEIAFAGQIGGIDQFTVNMGRPDFTAMSEHQADVLYQPIIVDDITRQFGIVSMGNPHAVTAVTNLNTAPINTVGSALQSHDLFPEKVNVGFMQIQARDKIALRVYERGVGETQACGTGACAAAAIGIARGELDSHVTVQMQRGALIIDWLGGDQELKMTGPAETVYYGYLE